MKFTIKLMGIKRKDERFSELFDQLAEYQDSRQTLIHLWATVEFENKEEMLPEISLLRAERRR